MISENDKSQLHKASRLALKGHGLAEPNPLVGCIITNSNGEVVGEGFHEKFGEAHAEVNALTVAGSASINGTAYVSLEPCKHHGKTPPCTQALLDAGITRVVIGTTDPNLEAGGGTDYLRSNGIEVEIVNDAICKNLIAPYTYRLQTGLPWITCKWAQTIDGCIETAENESPWISCKESQILVHEERSCVDAIVVGIGTVIADNPTLTVRNTPKHRTPLRVVIDPTLRIPSDANILNDDAPTLIAHIETADTSNFSSNQLLALPSNNGILNLSPLFRHLVTAYNATHVIVEGGSTLFQHLFEQELVNELLVFTSPNSSTIVPKLNMNELVKHIPKQTILTNQCGVDCVTRYRITW